MRSGYQMRRAAHPNGSLRRHRRSCRAGDELGDIDAFGFALADKGQGAALALAQGDDNAALAGLVFGQAAVNALSLKLAGRM